jgi:hypothetical protein
MNCKQFHEFHENHSSVYLHKDTSKGDVMSEYKYVEKSNGRSGVVAFIPTNINPDLHYKFQNMIDGILQKEFKNNCKNLF